MGFSQIVLGGVDLCYNSNGYSHARGSYEAMAGPRFYVLNETRIETNGGWLAPTTQAMANAATTLEEQASTALNQECQLINVGKNAAKISNVKYLSPHEIDLAHLDRPAWDTITDRLSQDSTTTQIADYRDSFDELSRGKKNLEEISSLCDLALKYNAGLFGRDGMKKSFKYKKKLDGIEKQLNAGYQDFVPLLKRFGLKDFLQLSSPMASETWSDDEVEAKGRRYYQIYKESALALLNLVTEAMTLLELRLEEQRERPDLQRLTEAWGERQEPGRALLWKARHPAACNDLDKENQGRLKALEQAFEKLIQDQQKESENIVKFKGAAHPEHARKKALLLFRKKDERGLRFLYKGLLIHTDPEAVPVRHLTAGYLAELAKNPEEAINEYHAVVNQALCSSTEEALRRIVSISLSLSNNDNALLGLECLTSLSPAYLPQYADLVKLLGDTNRALDLYADYLEKVPGDPQVLMRVANLYRELGLTDEALTVFRYLCEQEPDNDLFRSLAAEMEHAK
ncbi:MAG: tetratricopeptide repeat protein [Syntrophotaleaceae bacterium]